MPEFVVLLPTQFCCKNDVGYNIVSNVRHGIVLKGNETEDASWSENLENVHISPACFFWLLKWIQKKCPLFFIFVCVNLELLGHGHVGSLFISPFPLAYYSKPAEVHTKMHFCLVGRRESWYLGCRGPGSRMAWGVLISLGMLEDCR